MNVIRWLQCFARKPRIWQRKISIKAIALRVQRYNDNNMHKSFTRCNVTLAIEATTIGERWQKAGQQMANIKTHSDRNHSIKIKRTRNARIAAEPIPNRCLCLFSVCQIELITVVLLLHLTHLFRHHHLFGAHSLKYDLLFRMIYYNYFVISIVTSCR